MIHTHLNLTAGYSHALPSIHSAKVGEAVVAPLTFVLPELTTESKVAKSSGRLPPSCEIGSLYIDPWGRTYMQPLIEYALQVTLRFRLLGETAIRAITAKYGIKVTAAPHCDPPSYSRAVLETKDVAASAFADVRRSRFAKPFARMRIAMAEPAPIVGNGVGGKARTMGELRLTWQTSSEAYDEFELGRRFVKIEYALQARTRYSTRAVGLDSRAVDDDEARPNVRVETTHLGTFEIRLTDRDDVRLESAVNGQRRHTGSIPIPVQIADDTIPTFSHCLASRDYVLLVKVAVQGLQHKVLATIVPVEVCESVAEIECREHRAKSLTYGDMLMSEVSNLCTRQ